MRHIKALALVILLAGCGGPLGILTGGGPNVAANVQAGKTNTQTLGTSEVQDQTITRPKARSIEQSTGDVGVRAETVGTVTNNSVDPYVLALLILFAGFLIPSPGEVARMIRSWLPGGRSGAGLQVPS